MTTVGVPALGKIACDSPDKQIVIDTSEAGESVDGYRALKPAVFNCAYAKGRDTAQVNIPKLTGSLCKAFRLPAGF